MAINTRTAPFTVPGRLALLRVSGFPIIPAAILVGIAFVAIFAELISPYNPEIGTLGDRFRPPFWQAGGSDAHLLGTDHLGRDVLSRLIFGARVSMIVGITAVLIAGGGDSAPEKLPSYAAVIRWNWPIPKLSSR